MKSKGTEVSNERNIQKINQLFALNLILPLSAKKFLYISVKAGLLIGRYCLAKSQILTGGINTNFCELQMRKSW